MKSFKKISVSTLLRKAKNYQKIGSTPDAILCYETILSHYPNNQKAKICLDRLNRSSGIKTPALNPPNQNILQIETYLNKKEYEKAKQECLRVLEDYPDAFLIWNLLGIIYKVNGQLDKAIEAYDLAIKNNSGFAEAYNNKGNALLTSNQPAKAAREFTTALKWKPGFIDATYNLGLTFQLLGDHQRAIFFLKKTLVYKPDHAKAYNNLGASFSFLGRPDEAIDAFSKAIGILPSYKEAYVNKGNILRNQGKVSDAKAAFNKAISIDTGYAEAYRYLSGLKVYQNNDPQIKLIKSLLDQEKTSVPERIDLCFTLAKISEDLGNFKDTFMYLKKGNLNRKRILGYDIAFDSEKFSKAQKTTGHLDRFCITRPVNKNLTIPIFILGMPRSGSTLIEQIITCHSDVAAGGELDLLRKFGNNIALGLEKPNKDKFVQIRNNYLKELRKIASGKPLITDKMPTNFLYISLILKIFPEAKIVHICRNAEAVCWSIFRNYFADANYGFTCELSDIVDYYNLYAKLMKFWELRYPNKIYNLGYDYFTNNQASETKRLVEYLEIDWQEQCLFPERNRREINTISSLQVRKKVYQGSSSEWKKFKPWLGDAFAQLRAFKLDNGLQ